MIDNRSLLQSAAGPSNVVEASINHTLDYGDYDFIHPIDKREALEIANTEAKVSSLKENVLVVVELIK